MNDRPSPNNREAERSVLGSILRDNATFDEVSLLLRADDFYADAHRRLYTAISALRTAGKPADLVILAEDLKVRGWVDDIGGHAYLSELLDAAPTANNVVYHARIVRDLAIRRNLVHVGAGILRDAQDGVAPGAELLEQAERRVFALAEMGVRGASAPIADAVDQVFARIDARQAQDQGSGLETGFLDIDRQTGGFQAGELVLVAARTSIGKTALALSIMRNVALDGHPVFVASLEQSRAELAERLLCAEGKVNSRIVRCGLLNPEEQDRIVAAGDVIRRLPIEIDDDPGQGVARIAANARRMKARRGDLGLVVVDYIGLIDPEDSRAKRHEQIGTICRRLKRLARDLGVPVLALAQLNRGVENRADGRPKLADLRESGDLEQTADVVLLLHRAEDEPGVVDVIVAKQRNGPTGELRLTWQGSTYTFANYAPDVPQ